MNAVRRKEILRRYVRHAKRFDEIASRSYHPVGLFPPDDVPPPGADEPERASPEPEPAPVPGRARPSRRQLEIVALIAEGRSNDQIAAALNVSVETVKSHVQNLLRELGARNRAHAVALSYQNGSLQCACPSEAVQRRSLPAAA